MSACGRIGCTRRVVAMRAIVHEVAAETGVPAHEITGPFANLKAAHARQYAYWRARRELDQSLPVIGDFFGKHHTTILLGIRAHERRAA